jgi:hypothetical protein
MSIASFATAAAFRTLMPFMWEDVVGEGCFDRKVEVDVDTPEYFKERRSRI